MNCPKINDLYDYLEGILSPERREELEEHLAVCPGCRRAVEDRKLIAGAASSLAPLTVPDNFVDQVMARIAPVKLKRRAWLIVFAFASSVLALTAMVMIASRNSSLSILLSAGRSLGEYFKSAAVLVAKTSTLLALAGKTLRPLLEVAYKGLSMLTSVISPGLQIVIFLLAIGLVVSLIFGMRKKFSLGDSP